MVREPSAGSRMRRASQPWRSGGGGAGALWSHSCRIARQELVHLLPSASSAPEQPGRHQHERQQQQQCGPAQRRHLGDRDHGKTRRNRQRAGDVGQNTRAGTAAIATPTREGVAGVRGLDASHIVAVWNRIGRAADRAAAGRAGVDGDGVAVQCVVGGDGLRRGDVGQHAGTRTAASAAPVAEGVFKVIPQPEGNSIKKLVNMYTFDEEHMGIQALRIKSLFYKYKAKAVVIDGNGLGVGLIDFMVIKSIDEATGDEYPAFDVINDTEGLYKKFKTVDSEKEAIYIIKANAPLNTEIHSNCSAQINAGKVKFLEDERFAKSKLLGTKVGENMTPEQRAEYLRPFTLTSILKEEMMNLREEHDGVNIILKQANRKIKKDKFSAFEYGLYYIKQLDESKKKRKKAKISDFMFYS